MWKQRIDAGLVHGVLKHVLDLMILPRHREIRAYPHGRKSIARIFEFPTQDGEVRQVGDASYRDQADDDPKKSLQGTRFRVSHS